MSTFTLTGILTGLVLIAWDVGDRLIRKRDEPPDLLEAAAILVACLAAAAAIKLSVLALGGHKIPYVDDEDRGIMVVGSVGVIWVSAQAIWRVLRRDNTAPKNDIHGKAQDNADADEPAPGPKPD